MGKNLVIIALLLALVVMYGSSTNPGYEDYKTWVKEEVKKDYAVKAGKTETSKLEDSLSGFVVDIALDSKVIIEDRNVYSLYTLKDENEDEDFKVLGVFNNFYVLGVTTEKLISNKALFQ